ncbi:MAG TPA: DUF1772 domain-containing protein [Acidimicrobiaceae bacterium]|nr:DUF1772 domain-containing protein [Acidimicrobiaceae bacterium]
MAPSSSAAARFLVASRVVLELRLGRMMSLFAVVLLVSTVLCALVTGFVFTYAVVVMPGLSKLGDREFIRAFQVTDQIIQNNHPVFVTVWVGSILSVVVTMVSALVGSTGFAGWAAGVTGAVYLIGVQGITVLVHLPLNNQLQNVRVDEMDSASLHEQRELFEARWTSFNVTRTVISCLVTVSLMFAVGMQGN